MARTAWKLASVGLVVAAVNGCGGADPEDALLALPYEVAASMRDGAWGEVFAAASEGFEAHGQSATALRMILPRMLEQLGTQPHVALVEDRTPKGLEGVRELLVVGILVGADPGTGDPRRFQPFRVVLQVEPAGDGWLCRSATLER
jgi:hypothetical protein